eukprot:2805637-Prymnesium_polylepis.1
MGARARLLRRAGWAERAPGKYITKGGSRGGSSVVYVKTHGGRPQNACWADGCIKQPSFGRAGDARATRCGSHRTE